MECARWSCAASECYEHGVDFADVIRRVAVAFDERKIPFALIGGMALAALGVPRATADVDLLVLGERADDVAQIMVYLGYRELYRSLDAANYAADDARSGRIDFVFARRPYSLAMLGRARPRRVLGDVQVRVVEPEDIIGLKVQASSNNPGRLGLDLADIQRLLDAHPNLDLVRVREYFRLFGREAELDGLLARRGA